MRKVFQIAFVLILSITINAQYNYSDIVPQRIVLNLTQEPFNSMAVTWRTNIEFNNSKVQYAETTPHTEFKKSVINVDATTKKLDIESEQIVYHYSTILKNLKPSTKYIYRVGHDSVWSEWNHFTTASDSPEPFSFVYLGDPQNDIKSQCSRVFREAFKMAPNAAFWLFAGDITTEPEDRLWSELFYSAGFIPSITPWVLVPGNHDHPSYIQDGEKKRIKTVTPLWNASFTFPENGIEQLKGTNYFFDYQGVKFIMLDTYDKIDEQVVWLEKVLSNNKSRWTVVSFHYPIYSTGNDRDNKSTRLAFRPLFDKYKVDLVLTGHDHTYARSHKLKNDSVVNDNEFGTVYVVSVSGPKMYSLGTTYKSLMAKTGEKIQLFQVINIAGSCLDYKSFDATGALFDSFQLLK